MVRRKVVLQSQAQNFSNQPAIRSADWAAGERGPSGYSDSDIVSLGFIATPKLAALIEKTRNVARSMSAPTTPSSSPAGKARCSPSRRRPLSTASSSSSTRPARSLARFVTAARSSLRAASNGEYLAKGKSVIGFANVEEDFADNAVWQMNLLARDKHVMPWRIEDLEEDRRQLHGRRALARLCGARRKSGDRSTEFLTARNR